MYGDSSDNNFIGFGTLRRTGGRTARTILRSENIANRRRRHHGHASSCSISLYGVVAYNAIHTTWIAKFPYEYIRIYATNGLLVVWTRVDANRIWTGINTTGIRTVLKTLNQAHIPIW